MSFVFLEIRRISVVFNLDGIVKKVCFKQNYKILIFHLGIETNKTQDVLVVNNLSFLET
jgi:hypothetical protein